jgi:hypothetical protein
VSYLPPIPAGLDRKEFQTKVERLIVEEADRLIRDYRANVQDRAI